jgi:hypothetical protein
MAKEPGRPKTAVILQSNYLPWKGYFDLIHDADVFVFYDDVQYTKNDWRNRNRVKAPGGVEWITVPVGIDLNRRICDVEIPNAAWQKKHCRTLSQLYGKAPHFHEYRDFLEDVFIGRIWASLSELNQYLIKSIATRFLGIRTDFVDSRDFPSSNGTQERLIAILKSLGAARYVSGPAGKDYLDPGRFSRENIELVWKDYSGYPQYSQYHPPFEHAVTILDLLFHAGPDAPWYVWSWRQDARP